MFCTYLTVYRGNLLPPFYIGLAKVEKIVNGYRGSVSSKAYKNTWKKELNENPHLFETRILTYHERHEDAAEKESTFQKKLNVVDNDLYINKCSFPHFSRIQTLEHRAKVSVALKGKKKKPFTEEHKQKLREAKLNKKRGPRSPEVIAKIAMANRGQKRSDEVRAKMKIANHVSKGKMSGIQRYHADLKKVGG